MDIFKLFFQLCRIVQSYGGSLQVAAVERSSRGQPGRKHRFEFTSALFFKYIIYSQRFHSIKKVTQLALSPGFNNFFRIFG